MLKLLLLMFSLLSFFAESSFAKTDFLKACELDSKSKLKLSLVKSLKEHGVALYLPFERDGQLLMRRTQDQVAKTFGFPPPSILIKSTSELRFLPYTMPGSHVLLITASDRVLDQERISRIADISKLNDITISILWLGKGESLALRTLASLSKGAYHSAMSVIDQNCEENSNQLISQQKSDL